MYQMKCMNPLHASLTDNLSDPYQTSKMLVVIQIQTVRQTDAIGWYFKSTPASVLKKNDTQAVGGIRLAPVKTEKSQFSIQALLLNDCKLLSVLIDTIIMTNVFNGMDYW